MRKVEYGEKLTAEYVNGIVFELKCIATAVIVLQLEILILLFI